MSATEDRLNNHFRTPGRSRQKRPRSAVTSGRLLFVDGDPNSAWSRRYHDLIVGHVQDLDPSGRGSSLSEAQHSLIRRASSIECELERLDGMLSRGVEVDLCAYATVSGQLRRIFETIGLERKQKDIGPTLGELMYADQERQRRANADIITIVDGDDQ